MNNHSESGTKPENPACPQWGLRRTISPCFGARLVQEGCRLHYLADRAGITGTFSETDLRHLDQAFPLLLKQLELMLSTGELNPRHQQCVTAVCQRADLQRRHAGQLWLYLYLNLPDICHSGIKRFTPFLIPLYSCFTKR